MKIFSLPKNVKPISTTLFLDYCWVCEVSRNKYTEFEEHHVVPSHLGGNLGATVSLCDTCHTKAHKLSEKLWHGKEYHPFSDEQVFNRCLYLAVVICRARYSVEKSSGINKRYKYSDTFTYQEHELIKKLQRYYGSKSQKALIRFALEFLDKHSL